METPTNSVRRSHGRCRSAPPTSSKARWLADISRTSTVCPALQCGLSNRRAPNRHHGPASHFCSIFFGPYPERDGPTTYRYIPAFRVCKAAMVPNGGASVAIHPDMFHDKIVIIGGTAAGTFDLKSSPLSTKYPGVEIHATAIDDLLTGQFVQPVSPAQAAVIAMLASFLAAIGVLYPRKTAIKLLYATIAAAILVGAAVLMFTAAHIRWLAMASPIIALIITTVGAFAWSYLTEDRQRRLVLKALSQYVSPEVAAEIERNPESLKLGGERRDMTVMFSDIQGFTDLSESMPSEELSEMLNFYLGEMSGLILAKNGTLDKYIGDAIMSFWNAPILQPDHAALACRAALDMCEREARIQGDLAARGAAGMLTRIGINTGPDGLRQHGISAKIQLQRSGRQRQSRQPSGRGEQIVRLKNSHFGDDRRVGAQPIRASPARRAAGERQAQAVGGV